VEQLYGYMVRNSKTFGILTTLRGWCFAYRQNQGELLMTPMFASNPTHPNTLPLPGYRQASVTTMMAIYYLSRLSHDTPDTYEVPPPGHFGEIDLPWADPDVSSAAPTSGVRPRPGPRDIQPAPLRQYGQQGYQPLSIRFEPWVKENQLGGKTWIVDAAPMETKAVLKLWDQEEDKHNEAEIYELLRPLWGKCIPTFIAVDIWQHSNSIVVEYIKVNPLFLILTCRPHLSLQRS
jgi:hypothetical protein